MTSPCFHGFQNLLGVLLAEHGIISANNPQLTLCPFRGASTGELMGRALSWSGIFRDGRYAFLSLEMSVVRCVTFRVVLRRDFKACAAILDDMLIGFSLGNAWNVLEMLQRGPRSIQKIALASQVPQADARILASFDVQEDDRTRPSSTS